MIETCSIAQGMLVADAMLKEAPVRILEAGPVSPGKFTVLVAGEVEEVRSALRRGLAEAGDTLVDRLFIPQVHPGVYAALSGTVPIQPLDAVGIIETYSVAAVVSAADVAAKRASVRLLRMRLGHGIGGKGFVTLTGEVSDVRAAVAEGAALARARGMLVREVVIPQPDPGMAAVLERVG